MSRVKILVLATMWGSPGASAGKESTFNEGDLGLIPGLGRSPGEGNGYPVQYSCLENPMDRGAWKAPVHRAMKIQTQLKQLSTHAHHRSKALVKIVVYTSPSSYSLLNILQSAFPHYYTEIIVPASSTLLIQRSLLSSS